MIAHQLYKELGYDYRGRSAASSVVQSRLSGDRFLRRACSSKKIWELSPCPSLEQFLLPTLAHSSAGVLKQRRTWSLASPRAIRAGGHLTRPSLGTMPCTCGATTLREVVCIGDASDHLTGRKGLEGPDGAVWVLRRSRDHGGAFLLVACWLWWCRRHSEVHLQHSICGKGKKKEV